MFEWNVEEMALMSHKTGIKDNNSRYIYECEDKVSREDKIAFVDSLTNGVLSYILSLSEKFEKEKDTLRKDQYGDIKTVSVKAWIKRNDKDERFQPLGIIDNSYEIGHIRGTRRRIYRVGEKMQYDYYTDIVDQYFHEKLKDCEQEEQIYFREHDEYSVLSSKVGKYSEQYNTTFGTNIWHSSKNEIMICNKANDEERRATIEELKELVGKYEQIDRLIEDLTKETHIVF